MRLYANISLNYFLLLKALLFVFCSAVLAEGNTLSTQSVERVALGSFSAVNIEGQLYFISSNGRYGIQGRLTDTWSKRELTSIQDIQYSTTHIDVKKWGLNLEKLNVISYGSGPDDVLVFVDPQCPSCKSFISDASGYIGEYTFKLIVVPALGDLSNQMSKSIFCAKDSSEKLAALINKSALELPQKENCETAFYDQTLLIAQLLEIRAVPFFISADGRKRSGSGSTIWTWLKG